MTQSGDAPPDPERRNALQMSTPMPEMAAESLRSSARRAGTASTSRTASHEGAYIAGGLLVALPTTWAAARSGLYTPGSPVGYWLGVAGASLMLLLFLYPLRKRLRALAGAGSTRTWFVLHMACGLAGPLLIALHSTLHLRSLNALIAFCAMVVVASSGLVGRYLYAGLHRGSAGHRLTRLEAESLSQESLVAAAHWLAQSPEVLDELHRYGDHVDGVARHGLTRPLALFLLGFRARSMTRRCVRLVRRREAALAAGHRRFRSSQAPALVAQARQFTEAYGRAARRAAQYDAFARLFGYWHVAHVPLVVILVLTAIAHVIAVHMY